VSKGGRIKRSGKRRFQHDYTIFHPKKEVKAFGISKNIKNSIFSHKKAILKKTAFDGTSEIG
jgi:hypothetical protein